MPSTLIRMWSAEVFFTGNYVWNPCCLPEGLRSWLKEKKNLEKCVTKVKQDNAGHMDTNTLTHTVEHEHTLYAHLWEKIFVEDKQSEPLESSYECRAGIIVKTQAIYD